MSCKPALLAFCLVLHPWLAAQAAEMTDKSRLESALAGSHRSADYVARDRFRHPAETLQFFGWKADLTVVEIWPGKGWYSEILAPLTRPQGVYFAAGFAATSANQPQWRKDMQQEFADKLAKKPAVYDHIVVTELAVPDRVTIAPPGSADLLVTFRNVHNWIKDGQAQEMFAVFAKTLKPGGVLGVVEHRAAPGASIEQMKTSGYVTEAEIIRLAESVGLTLEARSEINANPNDTKDHPDGVWSLPPTLRTCQTIEAPPARQTCIEHYRNIGESDRMTLRFRKAR